MGPSKSEVGLTEKQNKDCCCCFVFVLLLLLFVCLGRRVFLFCFVCFVFSLLSDQLAQHEGTVDVPLIFVLLKVSSGTRRLGQFYHWTCGCREFYILHGLWSQQVAWEVWYQVPPSSLWGSRQLKGSCRFAPSPSASVFVFVCLRLRPPSSSSPFVFVRPTSSSSSVFVSLFGSATAVCTVTVYAVFHAV